jgi:ABC-type uncharacterized transport system YnjBCD permease subunit
MEWLQLSSNCTWSFALIIWFFGIVTGYCLGRLHAAWKQIDSLIDSIDATIVKLEKGRK